MIRRLPPHGKALQERQRFRNIPYIVFIPIGMDCWLRAKKWALCKHFHSLVYPGDKPPSAYQWTVAGGQCVIEVDEGPTDAQVSELARTLLKSGAVSVTELFAEFTQENELAFRDTDPEFIGLRSLVKTMHFSARL